MSDARGNVANGGGAEAQPERLHVLVVDDDASVRGTIADVLRLHDLAVSVAANGAMALRRLSAEPRPDVVLLDLRMPVMDGEHFVVAQRQLPELAAIPVVLHTGDHDEPAIGRLGLPHVLRKPCSLAELLATLRLAVAHARSGG